jgi:hypothetical protein
VVVVVPVVREAAVPSSPRWRCWRWRWSSWSPSSACARWWELVALDLDALAAVVTIEHVAVVAQLDLDARAAVVTHAATTV